MKKTIDFYENYVHNMRHNLHKVDILVFNLKDSRKEVISKIKKYKARLISHFKIQVSELEEIVNFDEPKEGIIKVKDDKILNTLLNKLCFINCSLNEKYKIREKCEDYLISIEIYKYVIKTFNKRIVEKILEGYKFNLGANLGFIAIKRLKRNHNRLSINWGASKKLKKEIIERGGIPYNKETAPDGEKWFVYYTDDYKHLWFWKRSWCTVKNKSFYAFRPTTGKSGNIKKLVKYIKDNPFVVTKYMTHGSI